MKYEKVTAGIRLSSGWDHLWGLKRIFSSKWLLRVLNWLNFSKAITKICQISTNASQQCPRPYYHSTTKFIHFVQGWESSWKTVFKLLANLIFKFRASMNFKFRVGNSKRNCIIRLNEHWNLCAAMWCFAGCWGHKLLFWLSIISLTRKLRSVNFAFGFITHLNKFFALTRCLTFPPASELFERVMAR